MSARRARAVAAALVLVVATFGLVAPAGAWSRSPQRVAGADRYQTAVDLSKAAFPQGATSAVVVSGTAFPDGLAAGPLAAFRKIPVLLTAPDALPGPVTDELKRLGATRVTVVGGPAAVNDTVLDQLAAAVGARPDRLFGASRYDTAAAVAGAFPAGAPAAYVASGATFPDALAAGAAAAIDGAPLLLVSPTEAPPAATAALARLAPGEVRVLGGPAAVGDAALAQLRGTVANVRRIAGPDRYATAAALATDGGRRPTEVLVATGASFPDALAAATLAAGREAPIMLTEAACSPDATVDAMRNLGWPDVTMVGGTAAVSYNAGSIVPCTRVPDRLLAPGLLLSTTVLPGPRVVRVVTVDRSQGFDVRAITSTGTVNGVFPVSGLNRRLGTIVSVNGGFFDPRAEPTHALAVDGRLLRWPGQIDTLVGFDPAKPRYGFFGKPVGTVTVELGSSDDPLPIDLVNTRPPAGEELALVTPEWTRAFPDGEWCRAVLGAAKGTIEADETTVQTSTVESATCSTAPVPRRGDVLVAAPGSAAGAAMAELDAGDPVSIRWRVHPTGQGVLDVIGANATLVFGGQVADDVRNGQGQFFTRREARTAVAQRGDGIVLLVTVDKGPDGYSIGMTPREFGDLLVDMGAHDAANLDGGGSTAIAVEGLLANRPSDGVERGVNTAIVVVPRGTTIR